MVRTRVGYTGGSTDGPTYRDLADHTEAIEIVYDPAVISYAELLSLFWASHDPTRAAFSTQYRAAVFVHDAEQQAVAEATRSARAARLGAIATPIEPASTFWQAEDYHQKYRLRNSPLMKEFAAMYADGDDFVASTAAARANGMLAGHGDAAEVSTLGLSPEGRRFLEVRLRR